MPAQHRQQSVLANMRLNSYVTAIVAMATIQASTITSASTGTSELTFSCVTAQACQLQQTLNPWPAGAQLTAFYFFRYKSNWDGLLSNIDVVLNGNFTANGIHITLLQSLASGGITYTENNPYLYTVKSLRGAEATQLSISGPSSEANIIVGIVWSDTTTSTPPQTDVTTAPIDLTVTPLICGAKLQWSINAASNPSSIGLVFRKWFGAGGWVDYGNQTLPADQRSYQLSSPYFCDGEQWQFAVFTRSPNGRKSSELVVYRKTLQSWIVPLIYIR